MRVIDADALRKRIKAKNASNAMMKAMREECVAEIDDAPTIEPESCEDAVSRRAAINAMYELIGHWFGADSEDEKREIKRELDKLHFVQPEHIADDERKIADLHKMVNYLLSRLEQQWIPCSKSLPPAKTEVIVSCMDDSGDTKFWYTASGWVTTNGEYWIVDNEINPFVIAWMPLPEPWKEGETDASD